MSDALSYISPFDAYIDATAVVADAQKVNVPGHRTAVAIPTLYGVWPQQQLTRTLGDALAIDGIEDAGKVRVQIEAQGIACAGWSVPRGNTGNADAEGYAHGCVAAQFDTFILNWEQGWGGFWTTQDPAAVNAFFGGFWRALTEAKRENDVKVMITFVTNSAMNSAVSVPEETAWVEGSHAVALEAYIPGDPGLDPGNAMVIMRQRLQRDGHPDFPVLVILEQGDLPALAAQYADPTWGVQFWTLKTAAAASWPAATAPVEAPATPGPVYPTALPTVRRGLNTDSMNSPRDPAQLKAEGFDAVRFVMHDHDACRGYAQKAKAAGLVVLGVQARETGGYMLPLELVDVVQVGNEPDTASPSSWTRPVGDYCGDLRIYRQTYPGHTLIAAGMASGDPGYVQQVVASEALEGYAAIAVHPYAKTADEARALLDQYRALTNLPVVVSEWNRPAAEVQAFSAMLGDATVQCYWFADGDAMVPGFGMLDTNGRPKPEYTALTGLTSLDPMADVQTQLTAAQATIVSLEAKIAAAQQALAA